MKINKSLDIDLNIISPQKKHIRIHEGDVDSVDILIGVTVDDESVDLTGVMIKYDATINNYLVEQDADGSVVNDKISIPVTQNMTAMSGLLLIDVRMIQNDQILFTQTICATVEKAVVNGSTYIDFDKITIIQRMNALEEKMDYIEELVENFDTSKLIVSVNRPPEGAPVEVDVDLLRVGDTWILSGANIVYKLVEAQYNYQPVPSAEPYHKFTWQPLNERFGVGNTEPPTTVTYQPVVYTINEVQWSWLPIPEYFQGDHYQMLVDGESTYYICVSGNMADTGVCTYTWREEGGSIDAYTKAETNALLADKMDLAPLNPTAQEIEAMPSGQLYSDTVNHKGIIKGGQSFYDTEYINNNYYEAATVDAKIIKITYNQNHGGPSDSDTRFKRGDMWLDEAGNIWLVSWVGSRTIDWKRITPRVTGGMSDPPSSVIIEAGTYPPYERGDLYFKYGSSYNEIDTIFVLLNYSTSGTTCSLKWIDLKSLIPTNISAFTNDSGYLTLETLPIYDGTVI